MASNIPHSLAIEHLPMFVTGPGQTDILFNAVVVILIVVVMLVGVFYFALHALPEKYAHKANSRQLQIVAILSLIALFTHNNYFWIAALLLAAIQFPDFLSPLTSIARSLKKIRLMANAGPMTNAGPLESTEPVASADPVASTAPVGNTKPSEIKSGRED